MGQRKECIAMLLAGGQGSRLGSLTRNLAKPAVSFGGKYRIIDFSLSNCAHSGIDTVGVLTQYKPFKINSYVSLGTAWDLDALSGGLSILPPFVSEDGGCWYKGTANAVYQNMDFISDHVPEYVLIISGDHIYRMNYNRMLEYHKAKKADVTISVINVSVQEASRFGIVTTDEDGRISKFTEKPKEPDSTLASMGVYIFSWDILQQALEEDNADSQSDNDFGKNVIPRLLNQEKRLFAYTFEGYWKDVGTVESYYNANMELLLDHPSLDLFASGPRIYSNEDILAPQYIGPQARISNSLVSNGCVILGTVEHSILAQGVVVEEGAHIEHSILLQNSSVGKETWVNRAIVGEGAQIQAFCSVGIQTGSANSQSGKGGLAGITVIEDNYVLPEDTLVVEGSSIFAVRKA
ncbi:MAG: glucose-1-phosphate adenylyltransferase [Peptococcaceae bacterium]|nr:glucose-1-phosphate adenylyltransferase [Peptococcaceae bacterium]